MTASTNVFAAETGSSAKAMAPLTAIPWAPKARTAGQSAAVTPPIAKHGKGVAAVMRAAKESGEWTAASFRLLSVWRKGPTPA